MSISSTSRKAGPYSCNGVTTTFSFSFKVFAASDLLVVLTDPSDAESELVLNTGYTVSLNADQNVSPGGTITTTATHATGYKVTITTEVPATQEVTIPNGGAFYPAVLNDALDRLTVLVQQVQEQVSRCIKTAISSNASPDAMLASISQAVSDAEMAAAAAQAAADAFGGAGVLAIAYGGTGSTTASAARTALGLGDAATKTIGTGVGQVPTADQVAGLVGVSIASTAEAQGWTENTKALSALRLKEALQGSNQSLAAGGYQKFPGGLIVQWGACQANSTPVSVTFPLAFPTACYAVVLVAQKSSGTTYQSGVSSVTASGFSAHAGSGLQDCYYIAIGK